MVMSLIYDECIRRPSSTSPLSTSTATVKSGARCYFFVRPLLIFTTKLLFISQAFVNKVQIVR